jgi:hypothetical protein
VYAQNTSMGPITAPVRVVAGLAATAFPLRVVNGRLVDQNGVPFLIAGDAAWTLIVQNTLAEVNQYLATRAAQGFNTILVSLIEAHFTTNPPNTFDGIRPFLTPGDWTTPNPVYFDRAHAVVESAASRGFLVLLVPAYLGYAGGVEGFYSTMVAQGATALRTYGRYVGERFSDLPNIIWVNGGDYRPPPAGLALVQAVADGIRETDPTHLHTAHWGPESGASDVDADYVDVDTTYTYGAVHQLSIDHYLRGGPPRFVIESLYEQSGRTTLQMRRQGYDSLLTGATGYVFGNTIVWQFLDGWAGTLNSPGATGMMHLWSLFRGLPWSSLVPDVDGTVVIGGRGTFGSTSWAPAASDGRVTVVYVPSARTITLALGSVAATARAEWYDPTSGQYRPVANWAPTTGGHVTVTTPGSNAAGDGDWVLVVNRPNA